MFAVRSFVPHTNGLHCLAFYSQLTLCLSKLLMIINSYLLLITSFALIDGLRRQQLDSLSADAKQILLPVNN